MNEENQMNNPVPPTPTGEVENQKGNFGWAVLGFFIPIVGWILYFCWKSTKPGDAKMAGIGGLVGFGINFLISLTSITSLIRQIVQ